MEYSGLSCGRMGHILLHSPKKFNFGALFEGESAGWRAQTVTISGYIFAHLHPDYFPQFTILVTLGITLALFFAPAAERGLQKGVRQC